MRVCVLSPLPELLEWGVDGEIDRDREKERKRERAKRVVPLAAALTPRTR